MRQREGGWAPGLWEGAVLALASPSLPVSTAHPSAGTWRARAHTAARKATAAPLGAHLRGRLAPTGVLHLSRCSRIPTALHGFPAPGAAQLSPSRVLRDISPPRPHRLTRTPADTPHSARLYTQSPNVSHTDLPAPNHTTLAPHTHPNHTTAHLSRGGPRTPQCSTPTASGTRLPRLGAQPRPSGSWPHSGDPKLCGAASPGTRRIHSGPGRHPHPPRRVC